MKKLFFAIALTSSLSFAQSNSQNFTHLCSSGENVLLSASLSKITDNKNNQGYSETKTDKYVSLCGNSAKEPIEIVRYRFGKPGNVELEKEFNKENPLELFPHIDHPGVANVMRFRIGNYTYLLDRSIGGGTDAVSLIVKMKNKQVAYFIARHDEVVSSIDDFLYAIDIHNIKKPISSTAFKVGEFNY